MKAFSRILFSTFLILQFQISFAQTAMTNTSGVMREVIRQEKIEDPLIITDKKLQADEGAFSKYSIKTSLSYSGPGIGDLGNKNQPNPDGVVSSNQTKLSGSISARYRIDGTRAVSFGTGVSAIHPMHGWKRTDVKDPFLSYDKSSRINDLQMRNRFGVSAVTTPEYRKIGEVAGLSYNLDLVHNIGTTAWALGFDSSFDYYYYDRSYKTSDGKAGQYYLSFYPNVKYQFNDKLNVNTSTAIMYFNPRGVDNEWELRNRTITQRIGVGYSYRRDVYLSPFITVYPDNLKASNSTFNLSATFSMN